jgi:molybdopterin/thiamine biosynthesis adenylyltransferase
MGVGRFHLADFDTFEAANLNRQFGATVQTLGRPKIDIMREMVLAINPDADVRLFPEGVQPGNVDAFLEGTDVIVDGIDFFAFDIRRLLFNRARHAGLSVLTSAPIGFGSTLQVFTPDGMSFDDYFGNYDGMTDADKFVSFLTGIAPILFHRKYLDLSVVRLNAGRGPVVAASCILSSALVATETVALLLKRRPPKAAPHYAQFDMYLRKYKQKYLWWGARNPLQRLKRFLLKRTMKRLLSEQAQTTGPE